MHIKKLIITLLFFVTTFLFSFQIIYAEEKMDLSRPDGGGIIPKLQKTQNDPIS